MSNAKETYQVRRSEFTRQEPWVLEALADSGSTAGFFLQFQSCFGRSAAPNETEDFKGLYMSQHDMAALMESVGVKYSQKTVSNHLTTLVEKGIISRAPVCDPGFLESASKRIVWVYVINKTTPHEFDRLAEKIALKMLEGSKYKGQAKNSAKKKEREAVGETNTLTVSCKIAQALTQDNKLKGYIVNYLNTSNEEHTVQKALNALYDLSTYSGTLTEGSFVQGTNSFKTAPVPSDRVNDVSKMRDALNNARQLDKTTIKQPEVKATEVLSDEERQERILNARKPRVFFKTPTLQELKSMADSIDFNEAE